MTVAVGTLDGDGKGVEGLIIWISAVFEGINVMVGSEILVSTRVVGELHPVRSTKSTRMNSIVRINIDLIIS